MAYAKIATISDKNEERREGFIMSIGLFVPALLSLAWGVQTPLPVQMNSYTGPTTDWGIQGEGKDSQAWVDSGDSTVLVVSEIQKGEPSESGYLSVVFEEARTQRVKLELKKSRLQKEH